MKYQRKTPTNKLLSLEECHNRGVLRACQLSVKGPIFAKSSMIVV